MKEMSNWIGPIVKHVLHIFLFFINTTAYHLGQYSFQSPSTKELHGAVIQFSCFHLQVSKWVFCPSQPSMFSSNKCLAILLIAPHHKRLSSTGMLFVISFEFQNIGISRAEAKKTSMVLVGRYSR